jgi:hypothetical protein
VLAIATRLQAVFVLGAFPLAIAISGLLTRRRPTLLAFAPAVGGLALVGASWATWRLSSHEHILGAYDNATGRASMVRSARFVWYHAGDLALLSGVFPICALFVLLWCAARRTERSAAAAYLAVASSFVLVLVVEVGLFASRQVGLLAERNLLAAAPLLFLAFALWLDRGGPGGRGVRAVAGFGVAAAILSLPLQRFAVAGALPDAFSLVPIYQLRQLTSLRTAELVLSLAIAIASLLFALLPRRALVLLPALLLAALTAASLAAEREVVTQARAQKRVLLPPDSRWLDNAGDGAAAYVYDGRPYWNAVWENVFWNRRIRWIYDLPGAAVPGPLPQEPVRVLRDGELRPDGGVSPARFAVIPLSYTLVGQQIASAPQIGTDLGGLALWRLDRPLRLATITTGLLPNGDVSYNAVLRVYACRGGSFDAVFLIKEPQRVRVFLDGRLVRSRSFPKTTTWRLRLRTPLARSGSNICTINVVPTGLLGTTRFTYIR